MSLLIRKNIILMIAVLIFGTTQYQVRGNDEIPAERKVDWKKAGLYSNNKQMNNWINVEDYTGTDYNRIKKAIDEALQLKGTTVIYLPKKNYRIDKTLKIDQDNSTPIRFIGNLSGDTTTVLTFANISADEHCILVDGQQRNEQIEVTENMNKSTQKLFYNSGISNIFMEGDWIRFVEPDLEDEYGTSSRYIGQISRIEEIGENYIKIKDEAAKKYQTENNLQIRKIEPVQNIGFENFRIKRTNDSKGKGATFKFDQAVNCWIRGVESINCTGYHVSISQSSHVLVKGSYFYKATNYDSYPGSGYGVVLSHSTTNCLIENNIFNKTRHAMLVGTGANCNVFGYNYSLNDTWDVTFWEEKLEAGDIRLHGRYPYSNLFEGNSVDFIWADATHGLNGPYNTIFRNNVQEQLHSYYEAGMIIWNSDSTNLSTNVINGELDTTSSGLEDIIKSMLSDSGQDNYDQKDSKGVLDISNSNVSSHYLENKPEYFQNTDCSWPAISPVIEQNIIPAEIRRQDSIKTDYQFEGVKVMNPLADIKVNEDAQPTKIDLENVFQAPFGSKVNFTKSIDYNSNPTIIHPEIQNDSLILNYIDNKYGEAKITIQAEKGQMVAKDTFKIVIQPINDPPIFTQKLSDTIINNNDDFSFYYRAEDWDNDSLSFGLISEIEGMSIKSSGKLIWNLPEEPEKKYNIKVYVTDGIDTINTSASVNVNDSNEIGNEPNQPDEYFLGKNYPNPFNPITNFRYGLLEESKTSISIYNVKGELIEVLVDENKASGIYKVKWNGAEYSSGVYFYRIKAGEFSAVEKCILMK